MTAREESLEFTGPELSTRLTRSRPGRGYHKSPILRRLTPD